ncbi:hypothetical protein BGZ76_000797 [Entomortierella beljakovae]|nr:hypothetical protein BGZ76_000797 [Entomortierella beljakovae]
MQNIPGLSFFDGLTKSRPGPNGNRSSSTETPLRDASSLRSVKSNDSLNERQDEQVNSPGAFEDPLSASLSTTSSSSSPSSSPATTLPVASFSRRAATVSAGSTPPIPRRNTGSSSSNTRSSILSMEGVFSSPVLNRRTSSTSESSAAPGRDRSGSNSAKETDAPTAKDVSLMAQGTQAYSMLKKIQEHPIELADIIRMLAILILPTCPAYADEPSPTRPTYEDHVIIPESNHGESLFVTLSGIRGILKPSSSSITLLGLATGHDFGTIASDASGPTKRSFFDKISKADGPDGSMTPGSNKDLRLVNSSKRPVFISVESVGSIHALLVDGSIPKPEGDAAPTPIIPLATGIAAIKDRSVARRTASSSSSVRSVNMNDDKDGTPLPKLPKLAADLPLEWDSVLRDLERQFRKTPFYNIDRYSNEFQRKYDDVRHRFEAYGKASGLKHRWGDQDLDEVQQWVEAWLCREMYSVIFPNSPQGMNGRDYLQDEQLQAKIAALNFMDLTLEHLGFVLEHPEDVEHIAQVVQKGGVEMQKLALVKSPTDKMNVILSSHRVVVDALNKEPAVQELVEAEEKKEAFAKGENSTEPSSSTTDSTSPDKLENKRFSLPKIPMDGVVPRIDASGSTSSLPKIPMDEGYDRPSQGDDKQDKDVAESVVNESEPQTEKKDTKEEQQSPMVESDTDKAKSPSIETNPANIALPTSPSPQSGSIPSLVISGFDTETTDTNGDAKPAVSLSPSPKRQYSADVLLPLLIFSVVKSNPPMLISNLSYIQRFKVQDQLTGELAYCLTNMMAVVSFLETLDPKALGLSNDVRVLSDISDIQASIQRFNQNNANKINFQESLDHTKALGHKVSQEIVGVAGEGIKVISDVVQDGYSKFLGRFLNNDGNLSVTFGINNNTKPSGILNRNTRALSAASSLAATAAASTVAEEERKRRAGLTSNGGADEINKGLTGLVSPAGVTNNVTALSVDGIAGGVERSSPHDSAMEHAAKSRVFEYIRSTNGPQIQFMACTDSNDLRLSDVKGLLEDYQRIGKILSEIKRLA